MRPWSWTAPCSGMRGWCWTSGRPASTRLTPLPPWACCTRSASTHSSRDSKHSPRQAGEMESLPLRNTRQLRQAGLGLP